MGVTTCHSFADLSKKLVARAADIKDRVARMHGKRIVVGIPPESTYPNGKRIVDVAQKIENGTSHKPPRPFVRIATEENKDKWMRMLSDGVRKTLREKNHPTMRPILLEVGEEMKKDIQQAMLDLDVWDTGRMHSSITVLKAR